MTKEELETQVKKFAISYWRKRNRIGDNFSVLDLIHFTTDFVTKIAIEQETKELEAQIEKMKCLLNEIYSEYGFSELVQIRNNLPIEIQEVIKEIKE